jgi:diguanylate cyclase (GGDEF)-like protein
MKGMNVVKVKVYNLSGFAVYSTDASQIGEDKARHEPFLKAKAGVVVSDMVFRNHFDAMQKHISDRNLVASYIPIREGADGPVKAVLEIYTDVTALVDQIENAQRQVTISIFVAFAVLYLFLYVIIRRADRVILAQEEERKHNEDRLRHQAFHDALTGLPNRSSFNVRLTEAIHRAKRSGKLGALMFLDLDRFKLINDSLGHDAGDQLLQISARRIQDCLRETDYAFRLSGDEFTVVLEDLDQVAHAPHAASRIIEAMSSPVHLNGREVIVNISIGITTFSGNSETEALIKEADSAMYRAKDFGRNQFVFYSEEMGSLAGERLSMETDLQRAFSNNEFLLYYQPRFDDADKKMVGAEALLRWNHPQRGLISPSTFIPLLEDMGLIHPVGTWVLRQAATQAQAWRTAGLPPLRVSVNISGKQFRHPGLVDIVCQTLDETGLPSECLELELTESMFIENTEHSIDTMEALKKLGVQLSIDDFGAGYSSLAYLKQFPIDCIKIDRGFVTDLSTNPKDAAICRAIAALAHSLGMKLVAEGVENQAQVEFLESLGRLEFQGFLFGRPVPPETLEQNLRQQSPSNS